MKILQRFGRYSIFFDPVRSGEFAVVSLKSKELRVAQLSLSNPLTQW
jgi:hypothetical protein